MFGWALNGRKPNRRTFRRRLRGRSLTRAARCAAASIWSGCTRCSGRGRVTLKLHETGSLCSAKAAVGAQVGRAQAAGARAGGAGGLRRARRGASPVFAGPDPRPMRPNIPRIARGIADE